MWAYEIFIPIAIVVGIGLVLGLVLAAVPVDIPAVPAMPLPYVKAVPKMVFAPRADRKLFKKSVNY